MANMSVYGKQYLGGVGNAADRVVIDLERLAHLEQLEKASMEQAAPQPAIRPDRLHVITAITNPRRFESRYRLYREFEEYVEKSGATLITVEGAFGEREHAITSANNPHHIQLRNNVEIWQKERMLNIALGRLPKSARYVAWVDADIKFERPDWAEETIHQLQHHHIVQMFSHAVDLGPSYESIQYHCGFGFQYKHGRTRGKEYTHWHPGFAWATRRECLDQTGGLIDTAILGAGDHHMALGIIGAVGESFAGGVTDAYKRPIELWSKRSQHAFGQGNMGFVNGLLRHYFHGAKAERQYESRWKILIDEKFDPELDIVHDVEGLWQLAGNKPNLRRRLQTYFESRNEDGNHAPPFFGR